ncbi:MAG TPA: hypothetical protein VFM17_02875 [Candidatus Eisenbacteria bacterium]|nr:hypothetical protein [Candidatus Eisenbacteria bacterium]
MESASPRADGRWSHPRRWREPARWIVAAGVAAFSFACVRDSLLAPFSGGSDFAPWIDDPWRSAYPWAVVVAALYLWRRERSRSPADWRDGYAFGALAFLAALAAGPALFRGFQALLPLAIRDDAAVGAVWIGLALEGWLPPIVLLHAIYETVSHVVRRAGGGWPTRGAGR